MAEVSGGVQEIAFGRPSPRLREIVRRYGGFSYSGLAPGTHQGLPSGDLTFIVGLGDPFVLAAMPGDQAPGSFSAFVAGLHLRPATIAHPGHGAGISVELSPLASRRLFGVPAGAVAHCVVDLVDLIGARALELVERLRLTRSWAGRFAVLDGVLSDVLRDEPTPSPELRRAWHLLRSRGGLMPTAELAKEVGYSRRHLSELFAAEFGVAPKAASRLLRFERARGLIDAGLGCVEAAVRAGYYDQAHMANEWRELAGMSPTEWRSEELRDRSDSGAIPTADAPNG